MHRILNIASIENNDIDIIEQPKADFIYITSVQADLNILSELVTKNKFSLIKNNIRAIHISYLQTPSQIDHYINKTIKSAKIVVLRIFGDKGTWSYGIEKLQKWSLLDKGKKLIVLSGTQDQDISLNELGNINLEISLKLSKLLREGGKANYHKFLNCLEFIFKNKNDIPSKFLKVKSYPDPYLYDWREENGIKIGIISYRSLFLANEIKLTNALNRELRKNGFSPKTIFVSSLKNDSIQKKISRIVKSKNIKLILTTTSFNSSINSYRNNKNINMNLFNKLKLPVFQILTSSSSKDSWHSSTIGLNSLDLLMQIIIPEFDGRITTLPLAFKETKSINKTLCSEITNYEVNLFGLKWLTKLVSNYLKLSSLKNKDKKVCLVISNYPIKNSRIANGVGLNTPKSILNILSWLNQEKYHISENNIPKSCKELMAKLIKLRTNDPETFNNEPLDFISIESYLEFWNSLPKISKNKVLKRWGNPKDSKDLEKKGFSINGIIFGNVCILIQPQRGYDPDSKKDLHSPDLPPPHRYLAQYYWIENIFKANVICHIGKHGTTEWLPGKAIGLSENCFPKIVIPPIPYIYPFIVNDPGEGSQAKRRTHATIVDHLTPPLDRSELYGYLANLEQLVDEYYEAKLLGSDRIKKLEEFIKELVLKEFKDIIDINNPNIIEELDSYLCELKESQIRTGLHTFGSRQNIIDEINLILCISRVPTANRLGLIQYISYLLKLKLNPWTNNFSQLLCKEDLEILNSLSKNKINSFRKALDFLEMQAKYLIYYKFYKKEIYLDEFENKKNNKVFDIFLKSNNSYSYFKKLKNEIYVPLINSYKSEKFAFVSSLKGSFIKSGPSGAPTRGKLEVLPTGKNFYSIDTRILPTESAWFAGSQSAEQILTLYKQENGTDLEVLAISLWATSTMRNGGEDICQVLALMGVRPLWDGPSRKVIDLEIIPLSVLGRPRVDVLLRISGMFRDSFPELIKIVSKAVDLISKLKESKEDNPLAAKFRNNESIFRIFGSAPGCYGAGLQELISNSSWETNDDLADAYLSWSNYKYDKDIEGTYGRDEFEKILKDIQVVMHNQDNKEHDILDSDDYYQFQGGITSAIKKISGSSPQIYYGDLSKFRNSKVTKLSKELDKVIRTRVLNPKWIKGMMENGYKGAFEFSATLDYLYGYDATTNLVSSWAYESIYKTWLCDKNLNKFFMDNNPWALRDISERFLELINRGMWKISSNEIKENLKLIINSMDNKIEKNEF